MSKRGNPFFDRSSFRVRIVHDNDTLSYDLSCRELMQNPASEPSVMRSTPPAAGAPVSRGASPQPDTADISWGNAEGSAEDLYCKADMGLAAAGDDGRDAQLADPLRQIPRLAQPGGRGPARIDRVQAVFDGVWIWKERTVRSGPDQWRIPRACDSACPIRPARASVRQSQ